MLLFYKRSDNRGQGRKEQVRKGERKGGEGTGCWLCALLLRNFFFRIICRVLHHCKPWLRSCFSADAVHLKYFKWERAWHVLTTGNGAIIPRNKRIPRVAPRSMGIIVRIAAIILVQLARIWLPENMTIKTNQTLGSDSSSQEKQNVTRRSDLHTPLSLRTQQKLWRLPSWLGSTFSV